MQRIDGPKVIFYCPQDLLARVDKISTHVGTTRSEVIRIMLETCCEGYEPLMKVGLLRKMVENRQKIKDRMIRQLQPEIG